MPIKCGEFKAPKPGGNKKILWEPFGKQNFKSSEELPYAIVPP